MLAAADAAVMVLDAAKGIEPQTLKLFEVCRDRGVPLLTFVNKWDRPGRPPLELLDEIESQLGSTPTPVTWPVGSAEALPRPGRPARRRRSSASPGWPGAPARPARSASACDAVARRGRPSRSSSCSTPSARTSTSRLPQGRQSTPVFFGSALTNFGVRLLLDGVVDLAPSPSPAADVDGTARAARRPVLGVRVQGAGEHGPVAPRPHRLRAGVLGPLRAGHGRHPRPTGKPFATKYAHSVFGQERETIDEAFPGDVVGLVNATDVRVGDTLYVDDAGRVPRHPELRPRAVRLDRAVRDTGRFKQFRSGIRQLDEEGVVQVLRDPDLGDQAPMLAAVGPMQFEVAVHRLEHEFGAPVELSPTVVPGGPADRRGVGPGAAGDARGAGAAAGRRAPGWRCSRARTGWPGSRPTSPSSASTGWSPRGSPAEATGWRRWPGRSAADDGAYRPWCSRPGRSGEVCACESDARLVLVAGSASRSPSSLGRRRRLLHRRVSPRHRLPRRAAVRTLAGRAVPRRPHARGGDDGRLVVAARSSVVGLGGRVGWRPARATATSDGAVRVAGPDADGGAADAGDGDRRRHRRRRPRRPRRRTGPGQRLRDGGAADVPGQPDPHLLRRGPGARRRPRCCGATRASRAGCARSRPSTARARTWCGIGLDRPAVGVRAGRPHVGRVRRLRPGRALRRRRHRRGHPPAVPDRRHHQGLGHRSTPTASRSSTRARATTTPRASPSTGPSRPSCGRCRPTRCRRRCGTTTGTARRSSSTTTCSRAARTASSTS